MLRYMTNKYKKDILFFVYYINCIEKRKKTTKKYNFGFVLFFFFVRFMKNKNDSLRLVHWQNGTWIEIAIKHIQIIHFQQKTHVILAACSCCFSSVTVSESTRSRDSINEPNLFRFQLQKYEGEKTEANAHYIPTDTVGRVYAHCICSVLAKFFICVCFFCCCCCH